jgi:transposase
MPASYLPYLPDQDFLLPHSMREWLPEGHLAYFINDTVDSLDLRAFHARYAKDGPRNQPFHPAMMVKVLIYGYATGVFSSRKLARKLHEGVAFRVLGAGNFPAHRTLSDFRAFHLRELSELFVQVVRLAREMGLVKLGTIAVDGTKIKANASRHKAMSYERMLKAEAELRAQIKALLDKPLTRPRRTSRSWTSRPSWPAGRTGCRKSRRPRRGCRSASAMLTSSAGATRTMIASPGARTANPRAVATSAGLAFPKTRPRRTSPTPTAG